MSDIHIATDAKASLGLAGILERLVNPFVMRKIYNAELAQLADYLAGPTT